MKTQLKKSDFTFRYCGNGNFEVYFHENKMYKYSTDDTEFIRSIMKQETPSQENLYELMKLCKRNS